MAHHFPDGEMRQVIVAVDPRNEWEIRISDFHQNRWTCFIM